MELSNKSVIITDMAYSNILFKYRNNYPTKDIKIITKNDLIDKLSFIYIKDPIYFLINEMHIEYSKAKRYAQILRIADLSKNESLKKMYNDLLKNGYIKENTLSSYEFKDYDVYLFELDNDKEVKNFLNRFNVNYNSISFNDLDIKEKNNIKELTIYQFKNKYQQFNHIFSNIRKTILENDSLKNKIEILIDSEADIYYLSLFSNIYKIDYITNIRRKLIENTNIKTILNSIYNNKSFEIINTDDYSLKVKELIDNYNLSNLDFEFAYLNLVEILSGYTVADSINDRGIKAKSIFNINNSINYVTNFKDNSFYKEYADTDVLSDSELEKVGLNTSYVKTILDRNLKLNYLKYNELGIISRCELHLSDSIFNSQFVEEFGLKDNIIKVEDSNDGIYTSKSLKILETKKYDDAFYFKPVKNKDINTYDHSFKGINNSYITNDNKTWHLTDLESYVDCPYKYYLNKIIPLYDDEYYNRALGTLIHSVFEDVYHADYNFENAFTKGKTEFVKMYTDNNATYYSKFDSYLEIVHLWLEKMVKTLRLMYTENMLQIDKTCLNINGKTIDDSEITVGYELVDEDNIYKLSGRIDKIIWTKANDKKYYTIIDYKSGKEDFNFKLSWLGKSIQLPLYYHAIENYNTELKNDGTFGGFAIQHTYKNSLKDIYNEKESLSVGKLKGLLSNDRGYLSSICGLNPNDKNAKLFYDLNKYFDNDLKIFWRTKQLEEYNYTFDDLVNDSKKAAMNIIKNVLNNKYDINPTASDLSNNSFNLACNYCGYKDICYKKKSDVVDYSTKIKDKFKKLLVKEDNSDEQE